MAQIIATISLCIFIIAMQHFYNWFIRKIYERTGIDGMAIILALTTAVGAVTFLLFKSLLEINK